MLVHSDATGVVVSVVNTSEATIPEFEGLSTENEIEVFVPLWRIKYVAHGSFKGIA